MNPQASAALAARLLAGSLPAATMREYGEAVRWIADELIRPGSAIKRHEVRAAVKVMNKKGRLYEQTVRLGEAWAARHGLDVPIAKHHGQALINLSALDAAQTLLEQALARIGGPQADADDKAEKSECSGLLARIAKQRFVLSGDKALLREATDRYIALQASPDVDDWSWPAINAVALLRRQQREAMIVASDTAAADLAERVRVEVAKQQKARPGDEWFLATLSEAYLALGKLNLAELWLYRFLDHPNTSPFAVDSYDRQLREIWQGSAVGSSNPAADRLVAIIARHLMRYQSRMSLSPADVHEMAEQLRDDPQAFEKNFSGERGFSLDNVKRMLAACDSIGCISNATGERLGTGFLVRGEALSPAFTGGPVFVTNAHVVSQDVSNAIRPDDVRVTFETETTGGSDATVYRVAELLFTSEPGTLGVACEAQGHLDVTIVRLAGMPVGRAGLPLAPNLPLIGAQSKAYVVGHPRGAGLQFSLTDSVLLDIDDVERLIHYRTPTDPGSSGSPVFNALWEVMALHHAGSSATPRLHGEGTYEANEGIAIGAIRRKLPE